MKIYIQTGICPERGWLVRYAGSKRECASVRRRMREDGVEPVKPSCFDVKPTKKDILNFLRNHTPHTDNG